MTIGTSLGQTYADPFEMATAAYTQPQQPKEQPKTEPEQDTQQPQFTIDRDHHVPLAASALSNQDGVYGIAVDHRIPSSNTFEGHTYDPTPFVALHEMAELPHMQNLIAGGQSNSDAYKEAHDKIATPVETAAVRAYAASQGLDPDAFHDNYKQFWRDHAAIASQPTDKDRHPDAHTTQYGLDDSEGAKTYTGTTPVKEPPLLPPRMQRLINIAQGAGKDAWNAFTIPHDVMSGELNPESPEGIKRATNLAGMMVGAPGPRPEGSLGSFAGIGAKTADFDTLATAKTMANKKFGPEAIFTHTGWFKGPDNKWRYELDSSGAKITQKASEEGDKLSDIYHHPELYAAYPELKDVTVKPMEEGSKNWGIYNSKTNTIKLNFDLPNAQEVLHHEIQHVIQRKEGFDTGSNTGYAMRQAEQYLQNTIHPASRRTLMNLYTHPDQKNLAYSLYRASPGEQEADLAAYRAKWSKQGRAAESPMASLERFRKHDPQEWPQQIRYPTNEPK